MDWALQFYGPRGGPWTSGYYWTHIDTTKYIGWKGKVYNARDHALHRGDTTTEEYSL